MRWSRRAGLLASGWCIPGRAQQLQHQQQHRQQLGPQEPQGSQLAERLVDRRQPGWRVQR